MRLHSDHISSLEIKKAATVAGVDFTRFTEHKSRKRAAAFDVILTGSCTRRQNGGPDMAATWDEWGIFLGILFDLDESMVTPYYRHAEDFHWQTGNRFAGLGNMPFDFKRGHQHKWDFRVAMTGNYWVHDCQKCTAVRRYTDKPELIFDS